MPDTNQSTPVLPGTARLPINRCNLPADIIGSLTYQAHPQALYIDGVRTLHKELYQLLDRIGDAKLRKEKFVDYMSVHFRLHASEEMGFENNARIDRRKANYMNIIKGWFFDSNTIEGAVLKSWAESRFGLITQYHKQQRVVSGNEVYDAFLEDRAKGLYNTNALESQLDLLYSYCQYELQQTGQKHWILYRGTNKLSSMQIAKMSNSKRVVLLNNVNSFSSSLERASEFGDQIIVARIPITKVVYYSGLLPMHTAGESEVIVLGGLCRIAVQSL